MIRESDARQALKDACIAGAIYLGWAVAVVVLAVALGGCAVAPDTLCQLPRPVASVNDTATTFAAQWKAAKAWDSQCTVRGWVTRDGQGPARW